MEASGKMGVLDRMLRKLKERGHRVTLFSQYNRMLDVIEDYLIYRGYKCALLPARSSFCLPEWLTKYMVVCQSQLWGHWWP